jgi:hypothetical protein
MNPFETLRHAFRSGGTAADQTYSIVLLEKHHHFLRKERLREAAEKAFGHSFAPGNRDYTVTQSTSTFLKVGDLTVHITQSSTPQVAHPHEIETKAGDRHLHHHAWREHKGYLAFDMWGHDHSKHDSYRVLAQITAELLDENVLGIFLPHENDFYPHDGSALDHLKHLQK